MNAIDTALFIGIGVLLLIVGFAMIAVLGRNYGPCQSALMAAVNQESCEAASIWHWAGIIGLVAGGAILLSAIISAARN